MKDDRALERFLARAEAILHGHDDAGTTDTRVGPYRLLRRLGQGGMGVVWLAEDTELRRLVAIKLLASHMTVDREAIWRFGQEATAAARLEHAHIVAIHTAGVADGLRYLVMDHVDGVGLDRLLALLRGRRPHDVTDRELHALLAAEVPEFPGEESSGSYVRRAVEWVLQTADALQHAHGRGVLHRDVKPSNLLVDRHGHVRMVDFGLARIEEAAPVTRTGAILGTLTYMAPEALAGKQDEIDARADVYGLGAVLFELLAFRPPFLSASLTGLIEEINKEIPARLRTLHPGIPRDLELVTAKCLAKDRAHRYATAQDLADDLRRFLENKPVRARPANPLRRARYWARRNPGKAVALAIVLLVAAATGPVLRYAAARRAASEADQERRRARALLAEHERTRTLVDAARSEYEVRGREIDAHDDRFERRAGLIPLERRVEQLELDLARTLEEARGALERAARIETPHGGPSQETRAAFADYFLFRFELADAERDAVGRELFSAEVRRYDDLGEYVARMDEPGTLTVTVTPADAEVFLFRYKSYEQVRKEPVVPRLVPVPVGGGPWADFFPGDTCVAVTQIEPGSPAAERGLVPGDLVVRIRGSPANGVFVTGVTVGGRAAAKGVAPWDRIHSAQGRGVRTVVEWRSLRGSTDALSAVEIGRHRLTVAEDRPLGEALGVEAGGAADVLAVPAPAAGGVLTVLRAGELVELPVPSGRRAGLAGEVTAYPLVCGPDNRIPPGEPRELAAGSYLLVARAVGHEPQRFPVLIGRRKEARAPIELLREGTTPAGFVWIPRGPFLMEGDPGERASPAMGRQRFELFEAEGFFIRRTEVSTGEWFEFLNDPAVRAEIERRRQEGKLICLPRHYDGQQLYTIADDGSYVPRDKPATPIRGISREDVEEYLAWRNRRNAQESRRWDLPEGEEWQKAARGVDGRLHPWGDRYDTDLFHNMYCRTVPLPDVGPRFEPRDESPYGVWDMAGSRREWTKGGLLGSSWGDGDHRYARASFHEGLGPGYFNWTCGFRPVLRRNTEGR